MAESRQRARFAPPPRRQSSTPLVIAVTALVAGCAGGTGIVPVGPDTYTLSELRAPVRGGGAEAERAVFRKADGFCRQQGRTLVILDARPDGDPRTPYWPTAFDATFQCRGPGSTPPRAASPSGNVTSDK